MSIDVTTLTDTELRDTFDELCARVGACHNDDRRAWHDALMDVIAEQGRRAEVWIAERMKEPA